MSAQHSFGSDLQTEVGAAASSRCRRRAVQPPALTTTIGFGQTHASGLGLISRTPISTTSLSSPFSSSSIVPQSPYLASPAGTLRGTSPMALRNSAGFSVPYNPQQWASSNSASGISSSTRRTNQPTRVVALMATPTGPDEPVASPPPPYSPRRTEQHRMPTQDTNITISPCDTLSPRTDPSQYNTPTSAATTISPDGASSYCSVRSPRSSLVLPGHESPVRSHVLTIPPPPPTSSSSSGSNIININNRVRSSSKNRADRLLSSLASRARNTSTPPAVNAIDTLQEITARALGQTPGTPQIDSSLWAPASRRAASTGAISINGPRGASHSPNRYVWETGMPLPPPPPGPPPTVRSQSMSRSSDLYAPSAREHIDVPRTRRQPVQGTSLATVPPTPADWREEEPNNHGPWPNRSIETLPLHIDTSGAGHTDDTVEHFPLSAIVIDGSSTSHMRRDSVNGALIRSPAVRNRSSMGIRERRSASKRGKARISEDLSAISTASLWGALGNNAKIVDPDSLSLSNGNSLSRRQSITEYTSRSRKSIRGLNEALNSAGRRSLSDQALSDELRDSNPQPDSTHSNHYPNSISSTPPFSPGSETFQRLASDSHASPALPPHPSPTCAQRRQSAECDSCLPEAPYADKNRPISHLVHLPDLVSSIPAPLVPLNACIDRPVSSLLGPESPTEFARRAIERHRNFANREAAASNDAERLDLFTQYVVAESRIRRDRYALIFGGENMNIDRSTEGMFEHPAKVEAGETEQEVSTQKFGNVSDRQVSRTTSHASYKSTTFTTASRDTESPLSSTSIPHSRPESTWWNDYVPCLSPIASMSVVTGQDEMDSRGRAQSRWWESASCDSINADAFKVLERSKRESKYMGVPREPRKSLCSHNEKGISTSADSKDNNAAVLSQRPLYGADEYPAEKTGWHDETPAIPPPAAHRPSPPSAPYTPNPKKLDISRLVTLPPPYPRHHPAVNNSHPDLFEIRTTVRSLGNIGEADFARQSHRCQMQESIESNNSWRKHLRSRHNQDMRHCLARNGFSQEEFDQAEAGIVSEELEAEKDLVQSDFDLFQTNVVSPMHSLFSAHIRNATATFDQLSSHMCNDAQLQSPNVPQEEGDEQPELLEKLTQLKWLFEAREALYREMYNLLSDRNEKYKDIVVLPYKQSHNIDKVAEAELFFARDSRDRRLAFEKDALARYSAFLDAIESNVVRGVEVQLSAFWDIAPSLLKLLQQIPDDLYAFEIQIPWQEYLENPSYHQHALQYLFSLLRHAEKSTYQFIESQINLLCLLHEVKEGCLAAEGKVKVMQIEERTVEEERGAQERRLTDDLKEKVGVVEGLWEEGLGAELRGVRARVKAWLVRSGGWDEDGEEA